MADLVARRRTVPLEELNDGHNHAREQKPHWSAWHSQKPSWTGCSSPLRDSPSTVVTSDPSAWTANIVQDLTAYPSTRTVQAPQTPVSHPTCVPVNPHTSRRN